MSNSYGENIKLTIFGQSHSKAIGMTLEGLPAGQKIDMAALTAFMERRAPGRNAFSTPRKEADAPEFLCGVVDDVTCGTPITAIIRNGDTKSKDYSNLRFVPRPGHADYTAEMKYGGFQDYAGGGHFSGRLTAPMCIAGGICKQLLEEKGISVTARIRAIGPISDESDFESYVAGNKSPLPADKAFPVLDDKTGEEMQAYILSKKEEGDSVGGIVECVITGLPAGIGDHMFGGMENRISQIVFGIPAVKGVEFGCGFESAKLSGSENNDAYCIIDGTVKTQTNHCGGILGGITNGMPLTFKAALKPTPSIYKKQQSVDLRTMEETTLQIEGRHDPCIVQRAVPVVEAAAAIAVYDAMLAVK